MKTPKLTLLLFTFIVGGIVLPVHVAAGNYTPKTKSDSILSTKVKQWMSKSRGLRFIENKGQMFDMQRKAVPNVLYQTSAPGMNIYVTTTGLSYVFTYPEKYQKNTMFSNRGDDDSIVEDYCRADMELAGADIRKENITQEDESRDRTDYYYGGICPDGILNVHSYGKITIKNIYPGIDWVLYSSKHGLKYDFVVHPGADPEQISLRYKWADKPKLQKDGSIKIHTPMGTITEGTPLSYTADGHVGTSYLVKNNEIHFKTDPYVSTKTLTIDPVLVWATYYDNAAGEAEDVFSIQADGTSVWITGVTGPSGFPTLNPGNGAYFQGVNAGVANLFILQFSTSGVLQWGTYYGGSGYDQGYSIYSDKKNVWVTGNTISPDFPTFNPGNGAYFQGALGRKKNLFILQFSTTGVRKWATYYGGSGLGGDEGNSIQSDGSNVWVTGIATSPDFPKLNPGNGAYFQGVLGGGGNPFILKFNTAGVREWATYFGGNNIYGSVEMGNSIYSDGTNVWVTGATSSSNFPTLNAGKGAYFQGAFAGGSCNIFISQFDTAAVLKWSTYYGGNNMTEQDVGNSINSDGTNVWVTGITTSTNFPTLNPGGGAYFQGTNAIGHDAFILKFDTGKVRKWATYYEGSGSDNDGYTIQSDGSNVWVCGMTESANLPTLKPACGFYQDTMGGGNADVFILQFDTAGVRKWATYYGTDIENDGSYVCSDGQNLFIAGDAEANRYPLVDPGGGAYYFDMAMGEEALFVGKFIIAGGRLSVSPTVSICRGSSTTLRASGGETYSWSPANGLSATNIADPVASPTVTTVYTLSAVDSLGCGNSIDSIKVLVDTISIMLSKDTSICKGSSVTLHAGGGTNYLWSTGATTNSISVKNVPTTQIYTISITNGLCTKDTSIKVTVFLPPFTKLTGSKMICPGDSVILTDSGGGTYLWSTGSTSSSIKVSPPTTTTYTVIVHNGCSTSDTAIVRIDNPQLTACCDGIILGGDDTTIVASGNGIIKYLWKGGNGVTCLNPLCDSVKVSPTVSTTYTVTGKDSAGCEVEKTITIIVEETCVSLVIPNVFTPDYKGPYGVNTLFYIKTENMSDWSITIYDRWGKEMFTSTNPNNYWNGNTESGNKVPDGVYYYIIGATCQGNTYKKDGFVQVIR